MVDILKLYCENHIVWQFYLRLLNINCWTKGCIKKLCGIQIIQLPTTRKNICIFTLSQATGKDVTLDRLGGLMVISTRVDAQLHQDLIHRLKWRWWAQPGHHTWPCNSNLSSAPQQFQRFQPETSVWLGSFGLKGKEFYHEKLLLPSRFPGTPHLLEGCPSGLRLLQESELPERGCDLWNVCVLKGQKEQPPHLAVLHKVGWEATGSSFPKAQT